MNAIALAVEALSNCPIVMQSLGPRQRFDAGAGRIDCSPIHALSHCTLRTVGSRVWALQQAVPDRLDRGATFLQSRLFADARRSFASNTVANHPADEDVGCADLNPKTTQSAVRRLLTDHRMPVGALETMTWLLCHEVSFHVDVALADAHAFLVWQVAGPAKSVVFPNMGIALDMKPGDAVLFDGHQPHGVRLPSRCDDPFTDPNATEDVLTNPEDVSVYLASDLRMSPLIRRWLGIDVMRTRDFSQRRTRGCFINSATGDSHL